MIPDYQTLMLPVLKSCAKGEVATSEVVDVLADEFQLTEEEQKQLLPSGKQAVFLNRIQWAKTYLKQAGLLNYPARGCFALTQKGRDVLATSPVSIDNDFLNQFEAFQEFRNRKGTQSGNKASEECNPGIL